ncbi:MAG: G5 domain-containing protein [Clostridiales bacterium]|nr:G5 domain-containing protein [Clostridiales bacterium]
MIQPDSAAAAKRLAGLVLRLVAVFALVLVLVLVLANPAKAKNVYNIQADSDTYTIETTAEEVDEVLDEAGVDVSATDTIDTQESEDAVDVSITRAEYATLTVDKTLSTVLLQEGDTVQDVLSRLNVELGENDIVSMDLDATVSGGDSIVINRVEISYYDEVETSAYDTARVADPDSYIGTEYIKQEGVAGTVTYTYEKKIIDGGEPIVTLVNTETTDMVTEITAYGTKVYFSGLSSLSASSVYMTNKDEEQGTVTMSDGSTYGYSAVETYTATAYTSRSGKHTSTGRTAQVGVVAVDPSVIPYGTRMYITSGSIVYGVCVAGDCGVKGKTIDLYYDSSSQCYSFGRRSCTVYFLY